MDLLDGRCLVEAVISFPRYSIQEIYGINSHLLIRLTLTERKVEPKDYISPRSLHSLISHLPSTSQEFIAVNLTNLMAKKFQLLRRKLRSA
jgi:hypothetical protein